MVSTYNRKVDIKNEIIDIMEYRGLSTDIKPLLNEGVGNGSMFIEIDTGDIYLFSQEDDTWYKIGGSGGGANLNDYFTNAFTNDHYNDAIPSWTNLIKKVPEPVIVNGTNMTYAFKGCPLIPQFTVVNASTIQVWNNFFSYTKDTRKMDLSNINFSSICNNFQQMFESSFFEEIDMSSLGTLTTGEVWFNRMFQNAKVKKINLCNLELEKYNHKATAMFRGCTNLEELDISKFEFSKISQDYQATMFEDVPNNCLIYVKNQDQIDWLNTNYPNLTNIQIKGA